MFIYDPGDPSVVYDTQEAIRLLKGPDSRVMSDAAICLKNWGFWAEEQFETINRVYFLEFRSVESHPKFVGGWFIHATLPDGSNVTAIWAPFSHDPGYIWLAPKPRKRAFKPFQNPQAIPAN